MKDLKIAKENPVIEVQFTYSYSALLKMGIALLAKQAGIKVRSVPGHHIKLLEKFSELLGDARIVVIGDAMRAKRNADLYGGGICITEKEAKDFLEFVSDVCSRVQEKIWQ